MNRGELKELILALLDGRITVSGLESLQHELRGSEQARQLYVEYSELHSLLSQRARVTPLAQNVVPVDRIIRRQKRRTMKTAAVAAAAVVVLGLVAMQLFFVEEEPATLSFATSPGTRYSVTHPGGSEASGDMVLENGSRLRIEQGSVQLSFASGVKSVITAPADMTLHEQDTLYINRGTAWFHVPRQAVGFTVRTSDLNIVDLGTEFGVLARPDDHDEVHVFKGKVRVTANRLRRESAVLDSGDARRIDPVGRLDTIPAVANTFLTSLPATLPYLHWSFDRFENGGFAAHGTRPDPEDAAMAPRREHRNLLTDGRFGRAVRFTGRPGDALVSNWPGLSGDAPRTAACWVSIQKEHLSQYGSTILVWGRDRPAVDGWREKWKFAISPDGKPAVVGYNGAFVGSQRVADGIWHHLACTHTAGEGGAAIVKLFVDGREIEGRWNASTAGKSITSPDTVTDAADSKTLRFGINLSNTAPIRAMLDEVYIFEGALDARTILQLATSNRIEP